MKQQSQIFSLLLHSGTPLGEKTIEIASKVANDTAEELKKQAEEIDSEPIELEWILEPEIKQPTPPPEPTPELPPTPAPSPPPKVELHMDALERRMRKAKGILTAQHIM